MPKTFRELSKDELLLVAGGAADAEISLTGGGTGWGDDGPPSNPWGPEGPPNEPVDGGIGAGGGDKADAAAAVLETIWGDLKRGVESAVNDGVKDRFDEHVNKDGMTAKTFDYPDGVRAQLFSDGVAFIFLPGDNKPDLMIKNMNNGHYDYSTNGKDWQLK